MTEITRLERLYTLPDIIQITGMSKTSIYREIREDRFPRPIVLSPGRRAWRETALRQWLNSRPTTSAE